MTEQQKLEIVRLRKMGWGYKRIGQAVDLSRDIVRNYCKRYNITNTAIPLKENERACLNCGTPFVKNIEGRARKFCATECRRVWGAKYGKMYQHKCRCCGKTYESRASKQKFCSNECYVRDRFWRKENAAEIAECLLSGKKPAYVPQWIKEVIASWEEE